ncbi:hypothetical protein ACIQXM_14035 [Arthrobacter sp. NPDC097144]|uniref:hypothetical protein n=1 Tax=Arthrobacter sp. NPDC097144 TaxID=3363946 RepID=UPI00381DEDC9
MQNYGHRTSRKAFPIKRLAAAAILVAGGAATLIAAALPNTPLAAAPEPISGIVRDAEAYMAPDPVAEEGVRQVVSECMANAGFDYTPAAETEGTGGLSEWIGFERLDAAVAKAEGYGGPVAGTEPAPGSDQTIMFSDPAFDAALYGPADEFAETGSYGTRAGGCRGEAVTAIYGDVERYTLATVASMNAFPASRDAASRDPEIQAANQDWQDCMAQTPYSSLRTPGEARTAGEAAGGQEEIKIAVTDAVCREETNLQTRIDAVFDKYLTTEVQQMAPGMAEVTEIKTQAAQRALEISRSSS